MPSKPSPKKTSQKKVKDALALFREGFSCPQAVLAAWAAEVGIPRRTALKISQPFGGGLARSGDLCGAVAGAALAIGARHGRTRAADEAAREKTYALVLELLERFRKRHGALFCRDLLGHDLSTPAGRQAVKDRNLHETLCTGFVQSCVEILEDLLAGPRRAKKRSP